MWVPHFSGQRPVTGDAVRVALEAPDGNKKRDFCFGGPSAATLHIAIACPWGTQLTNRTSMYGELPVAVLKQNCVGESRFFLP